MTPALLTGLTLGTSAGFSPGPLSTLVITQTLRFGTCEGIKTALVPIITDGPIVLVSIFLLSRLAHFQLVLAAISFAGSLVVCRLAYLAFRTKPLQIEEKAIAPRSFLTGIAVNFLSPNPYLFWLTIGAPTTVKTWATSPFQAILFLSSFYGALLINKCLMAVLTGRARKFLSGKGYVWVMRCLGALLAAVAVLLLRDGLRLLYE